MPRGGARPHPRAFGRIVAARNRARAASARAEVAAAKRDRFTQACSNGTLWSRRDECLVIEGRCGAVSGRCVRADKDITSDAVIVAAFSDDVAQAATRTGLAPRSIQRAAIVCAEALAKLQENRLATILRGQNTFVVIKRSFDETPFTLRGDDGVRVCLKLLNQRCFVRWSSQRSARIVFPCVLLHGTDSLALLEGLERVSNTLNLDQLKEITNADGNRPRFFVHVWLGDSLAANKLLFRVAVELVPEPLHWLQRCESHICNLITARPFNVDDLVGPIFCLSKLLRVPELRRRLADGLVQVAQREVRQNILVGIPPPAEAVQKQALLFHSTLAPVLGWFEDTAHVDVFPRLQQLKAGIRASVALWKEMFTALHMPAVTHYCYSAEPGRLRCCTDEEQAASQPEPKATLSWLLRDHTLKHICIDLKFVSAPTGQKRGN